MHMKPHTNDNQSFADELFNCFKPSDPLKQIQELQRLQEKQIEKRDAET